MASVAVGLPLREVDRRLLLAAVLLRFLAEAGLLAVIGPWLLLEVCIFGLTGAAGGFVRGQLARRKA